MNKKLNTLIWIIFTIMFGTILYILFVTVYPFEVIKVNGYFKVVNPIVKGGELLEYQVNADKYMDIIGTKKCSFEDGIIFFLPNVESKLNIGTHNEIIGIAVPDSLPEGTYKYHCIVDYQISPFRIVTVEFYTESFTVIK